MTKPLSPELLQRLGGNPAQTVAQGLKAGLITMPTPTGRKRKLDPKPQARRTTLTDRLKAARLKNLKNLGI